MSIGLLNTLFKTWNPPMSIIKLFKQREEHFQSDTVAILKRLTPILDGVFDFAKITRDKAVIDTVMLLDHVVLINVKIQIKKDDIPSEVKVPLGIEPENLFQVLSVGIPIDMVKNATKESTIQFLIEAKERQEKGLPVTEREEIELAMIEKKMRIVH